MGAKQGRVVVEFADLEDLERIYRLMTANADHVSTIDQSDPHRRSATLCVHSWGQTAVDRDLWGHVD